MAPWLTVGSILGKVGRKGRGPQVSLKVNSD